MAKLRLEAVSLNTIKISLFSTSKKIKRTEKEFPLFIFRNPRESDIDFIERARVRGNSIKISEIEKEREATTREDKVTKRRIDKMNEKLKQLSDKGKSVQARAERKR